MPTDFFARHGRMTLFLVTVLAAAPLPGYHAQDKEGAGAVVSAQASAKDVGLPLYPGSKPHKDKDSDSSAANLGLWGGGSGFKLVVLKMETSDSPEKVAAFYRKALSRYGPVLDCSGRSAQAPRDSKDDNSSALTCDNDQAEKGGMLYKVGTKDKYHIASIESKGSTTIYNLISIGSWGKK